MSSARFEHLINKFPAEKETIKRLESFIASSRVRGTVEFTLQRLYDKVSPPSETTLALLLNALEQDGIIQKIVRVESPVSGGGIKDYSSILDVPEVLHDWRQDVDIHVRPEYIRILYKIAEGVEDAA